MKIRGRFAAVLMSIFLACPSVAQAAETDFFVNPATVKSEITHAYVGVLKDIVETYNDLFVYCVNGSEFHCEMNRNFGTVGMVDFDKNGVPELLIVHDKTGFSGWGDADTSYEVWGWNGTGAYRMMKKQANVLPYGGLTVDLESLVMKNGKVYAEVRGDGYSANGQAYKKANYYTVKNGVWTEEPSLKWSYNCDSLNETETYNFYVNGKRVTEQALERHLNGFGNRTYLEFGSTETLEKMHDSLKDGFYTTFITTSRVQPISIDGKAVNMETFLLDGDTYVSLRDLAAAMKHTAKPLYVIDDYSEYNKVSVDSDTWSFKKGIRYIVKDKAYEGTAREAQARTVTARRGYESICWVEKKQEAMIGKMPAPSVTLYYSLVIDGHSYVRLRDIANDYGFNLTWDAATRMTSIRTK